MEKFKGTPGPWEIEVSKSGQKAFIGKEQEWEKLARVFLYSVDDTRPGEKCNIEEGTANAHLIASAPELLEALQAVVRVADRATVEFDMARAAIAKALNIQEAKP